MRFVVLGGGCYGTFYARQLLRAHDAGALPLIEVLVVDADPACRAATELHADSRFRIVPRRWDDFLADYLETLGPDDDDQLVPPPFTPHLALAWLLRALSAAAPGVSWRLEPFSVIPELPFARQSRGGPLLTSHADWICPVHCIEPETCPKTRGPRAWDMADTAVGLARALEAAEQPVEQVQLFRCHHVAYGVGAYAAARLLEARQQMLRSVDTLSVHGVQRFIVGTVSRCHGALNLLSAQIGTDSVSAAVTAAAS